MSQRWLDSRRDHGADASLPEQAAGIVEQRLELGDAARGFRRGPHVRGVDHRPFPVQLVRGRVQAAHRHRRPIPLCGDREGGAAGDRTGRCVTARFGSSRPGKTMSDRFCRENDITHRLTRPKPTTTGKTRRFHRTLRRELSGRHGRTCRVGSQSRNAPRSWPVTRDEAGTIEVKRTVPPCGNKSASHFACMRAAGAPGAARITGPGLRHRLLHAVARPA